MDKKNSAVAVIKTGGKQYLVAQGDTIKVEKLPVEAGQKIVFEEVLMTVNGEETNLGAPLLSGVKVEGTVLAQARHKKLFGVKFKAKKRYMRVFGHKQPYTEVEINTIGGQKKTAKKSTK